MNKITSILLAFRPKTLTAALVPCLAATAMMKAFGFTWQPQVLFYALMSSFLIQIGTNLVNDAMDFKKGADTETRIGPTRITATGVLSSRAVMALGSLCFLLAVIFGVPLVMIGGTPIVVIGLLSVLMGYAYTSGPFPLAYVGLGDLFVVLFFGLVAIGGMTYLHAGVWNLDSVILGLQIGFHATVLIAINNFRDMASDVKANKRTLAVRFGAKFMRTEIFLLCLIPFLLNFYWLWKGLWIGAALATLALPMAISLVLKVAMTDPSAAYNKFLGQAAGLHLGFGLLLSVGFWIQ